MASNPRIDDLRKRLEKEPGSRLFAQLAEELRKAGDLDEAIVVSREGLQKHAAYPSARMTLGRALFDKGDLAGARGELESVLKGAPDNILASRLLAECLEGLGDLRGAVERFRKTLAMAPGDRQMAGKVAALDLRIESTARPEVVRGPLPEPRSSDAPIPLVAADEPFELETSYEAPAARPLAPAEVAPAFREAEVAAGFLEVEAAPPAEVAAADPPLTGIPEPQVPPPAPYEASILAPEAPLPPDLFEFDAPADMPDTRGVDEGPALFEEPPLLVPAVGDRLPAPATLAEFVPEPPRMLPQSAEEPPPPWVAPAPPSAPAPELISSTLAELYFNQGFTTKAIEVYRQVLEREPANDRARARLGELEDLGKSPVEPLPVATAAAALAEPPGLPGNGPALRRAAIERVIGRLEGLRAALRRS